MKFQDCCKVCFSCVFGVVFILKVVCYFEKCFYVFGEYGCIKCKVDSDYVVCLCEKQCLCEQYGICEKQMCNMFNEVCCYDGLIGENLVELFEMCFDVFVLCLGFVCIIVQVCQFVVYCYIFVDGQFVDCLLFCVKLGQFIYVKVKSEGIEFFQVVVVGGYVEVFFFVFGYFEVEFDKFQVCLVCCLKCVEVFVICEVQFVVEYYVVC